MATVTDSSSFMSFPVHHKHHFIQRDTQRFTTSAPLRVAGRREQKEEEGVEAQKSFLRLLSPSTT